MKYTETISHHGEFLAIIVRREFNQAGVNFLTPDSFSQQLAHMQHPSGKKIQPHLHNAIPREVVLTQEVLFIVEGQLRVDFYDREKKYLESRILKAGDVILLSGGGHGFEVLESVKMFEVKQGPYLGENDKVRFLEVDSNSIHLK